MGSNQTRHSTNTVLAIAGAVGLVAFLLFLLIGGWGFWASFFVALVIAAVVFAVLLYGFGQDASGATSAPSAPTPRVEDQKPAPGSTGAGKAKAPEPARAADPAPAAASGTAKSTAQKDAPGAAVKPSKSLAGQQELASKKGEWKYGEEGAGSAGAAAPKPAAAAADSGTKPEMLAAAREGGADDLKRIKGIGPKLEKMLNGMGVYHFDQIAAWTDKEIAWVDANLEGFKGRVSRDKWVEQAKTLAQG